MSLITSLQILHSPRLYVSDFLAVLSFPGVVSGTPMKLLFIGKGLHSGIHLTMALNFTAWFRMVPTFHFPSLLKCITGHNRPSSLPFLVSSFWAATSQ